MRAGDLIKFGPKEDLLGVGIVLDIKDGDNSFDRSIDSDAHTNFTTDIIMNKIEELPADFKVIINLRDIQELSYGEISRIMDLAIGTVKSRLNRARIKLRELLLGEDK